MTIQPPSPNSGGIRIRDWMFLQSAIFDYEIDMGTLGVTRREQHAGRVPTCEGKSGLAGTSGDDHMYDCCPPQEAYPCLLLTLIILVLFTAVAYGFFNALSFKQFQQKRREQLSKQ